MGRDNSVRGAKVEGGRSGVWAEEIEGVEWPDRSTWEATSITRQASVVQ